MTCWATPATATTLHVHAATWCGYTKKNPFPAAPRPGPFGLAAVCVVGGRPPVCCAWCSGIDCTALSALVPPKWPPHRLFIYSFLGGFHSRYRCLMRFVFFSNRSTSRNLTIGECARAGLLSTAVHVCVCLCVCKRRNACLATLRQPPLPKFEALTHAHDVAKVQRMAKRSHVRT